MTEASQFDCAACRDPDGDVSLDLYDGATRLAVSISIDPEGMAVWASDGLSGRFSVPIKLAQALHRVVPKELP